MEDLTMQHVPSYYSTIQACADRELRTKGYQLLDEPDKTTRLGLPAIAFLADLGRNTPGMLPRADRPGKRCP